MINFIRNWWYARMRQYDRTILWPSCVELAPDIDHAKAAFAFHAFHDPAWLTLGEQEITRQIDQLEAPLDLWDRPE